MNATEAMSWFTDKIPEFRSVVGALLVLARNPSLPALRRDFERLAARLPRLRQRVCEVPLGLGTPEWVDDEGFDLDHHLRPVAVPSPGGLDELLAELGPVYETPLDPNRPLWEAHWAEGLAGGRGAVFVKMHHCITGGAGGARLVDALLGIRPGRAPERTRGRAGERSDGSLALLGRAFWQSVADAVDLGGSIAGGARHALTSPRWAAASVLGGLRAGQSFARELAPMRCENPLGASRSLSRRLATFEMRLGEVDPVRRRLGATVNEVLLAVVCGALHRWCQVEGIGVDELRVLVPFDAASGAGGQAGSRMAPLSVRMPVGEANALRRLRTIQERMGALKADGRANVHPWFARTVLAMPLPIAEVLVRQQNARASLVCTSVTGPERGCVLGGQAVQRIYPWVPLSGDHPLAVAVVTYRDVLCVGVDVDAVAIGNLGRFLSDLKASYAELLKAGSARKAARLGARRPTGSRVAV